MTEEQDFFQIETIVGETVYACNICNEGFECMEELKQHIEIIFFQKKTFLMWLKKLKKTMMKQKS